MSLQASGWAASRVVGSPEAKLVLLLLASIAGPHGECWPDVEALAEYAEISAPRLEEALALLASRGLICEVFSDPRMILLPVGGAAVLAADPDRARLFFADDLIARRVAARHCVRAG